MRLKSILLQYLIWSTSRDIYHQLGLFHQLSFGRLALVLPIDLHKIFVKLHFNNFKGKIIHFITSHILDMHVFIEGYGFICQLYLVLIKIEQWLIRRAVICIYISWSCNGPIMFCQAICLNTCQLEIITWKVNS